MPIFTAAATCLIEVASAGSIRKASETLNTSASAVNRHILNLEAELGVQLLERLPRGVRPTPAGQVLIDQLRSWVQSLQSIQTDIESIHGSGQTRITVGLMECFAGAIFADVLVNLKKTHPSTTIVARVGGTSELVSILEDGELDLVVGFDLPPSSSYWEIEVLDMPVGMVMLPTHKFASRNSISLQECSDEPILLADSSLTLKPLVDSILPPNGKRPAPPLMTNSIGLLKGALLSGAGIALLSRLDVVNEIEQGTLIFVKLNDERITERLSICVRDQGSISASTRAFCDAMMAALHNI